MAIEVVAVRVSDHDRALLHRTDPQNPALRLIDDRESEQRTTDTVIGECKRPTFDIIGIKFLRAGAASEVIDRARHPQQGQPVRAFDDRHDQPFLAKRSCHAYVDVRVNEQPFVRPG